MRRKDREVTDRNEIIEIMKSCSVCTLAFFDREYPYCIPVNFGISYLDGNIIIYIHGASEGKKVSLMKENNKVGFSMNASLHLVTGIRDCNTTMEYESVCGNGILEIADNLEKEWGLGILMHQYKKKDHYEFEENALRAVTIYKLTVKELYGKRLMH